MRVIIAGSRCYDKIEMVYEAMKKCGIKPSLVVSGHARGVDKLGEQWAADNNIPCAIYPAEWDKYGKSAGFRRNEEMARNADMLVAIWDGKSNGTRHMIKTAHEQGLRVCVYFPDTDNVETTQAK